MEDRHIRTYNPADDSGGAQAGGFTDGFRTRIGASVALGLALLGRAVDEALALAFEAPPAPEQPLGNPEPGDTLPDGSPITVLYWFSDQSHPEWPAGPDGSPIPGDYVWRDLGDGAWGWAPPPEPTA